MNEHEQLINELLEISKMQSRQIDALISLTEIQSVYIDNLQRLINIAKKELFTRYEFSNRQVESGLN